MEWCSALVHEVLVLLLCIVLCCPRLTTLHGPPSSTPVTKQRSETRLLRVTAIFHTTSYYCPRMPEFLIKNSNKRIECLSRKIFRKKCVNKQDKQPLSKVLQQYAPWNHLCLSPAEQCLWSSQRHVTEKRQLQRVVQSQQKGEFSKVFKSFPKLS